MYKISTETLTSLNSNDRTHNDTNHSTAPSAGALEYTDRIFTEG